MKRNNPRCLCGHNKLDHESATFTDGITSITNEVCRGCLHDLGTPEQEFMHKFRQDNLDYLREQHERRS